MLKPKYNKFVALSIVAAALILGGCDSGSGGSNNKPAMKQPQRAPSPTPSSAADKQAALQKQAGGVITGKWVCNPGQCSVSETLQISSDLSSYVQTQVVTSPKNYNCKVDQASTVTISTVSDNGKVATISASMLDGKATYDGDPQDGTDCYDSIFGKDNEEADLRELTDKPVATTIILDRTQETLSIGPSDNSKPAQVFVKATN